MGRLSPVKSTYDEGRDEQFRAMMQQLAALEAKYKGVRGELLAKVRDELMKLKPTRARLEVAPAPAPDRAAAPLPSCRVCGRGMRLNGTDGMLVCQNGHTRVVV